MHIDKVPSLEDELFGSFIQKKAGEDISYAQALYAALCNTEWQKNTIWPRLSNIKWSTSWRGAGRIVAALRDSGSYLDWYCSGLMGTEDAVEEGCVTDEIRSDLHLLGWFQIEDNTF